MDKQLVFHAFCDVIESTQLWEEMSDALFVFGGELFETKFAEALFYHQELVWKMIKECRGYGEIDQGEEFSVFINTLYDLAKGNPFTYTDEDHNKITTTNKTEILDLFLAPEFTFREFLTINPETLEDF